MAPVWFKITVIVLWSTSIGISLARHGESKGNHNIWITLLSCAAAFLLYYMAGIMP